MELTEIIDTFRGPLVGLVASWGAPWGDAAEIAQDSLADAWLKREYCRGDWTQSDVFGRWLRGIALNRFRNWRRSRWRRRSRFVSLTSADLESVAPPASAPEPSAKLEALRRAIESLPTRQRQVVLMHYLEETSVNEVAALLSVTAKTVEGRLYQARRTLQRLLADTPASHLGKLLLCL